MPRKPEAYRTPLRSRKDIVAYIVDHTKYRYYDSPHPLCFNVKCYHVDLTFAHLLEVWREGNGDELHFRNPEWLKDVRERFDEVSRHLWDWGVEDACRQFIDGGYNTLWNGTEVDVKYSFEGRGGGWLSINSFEGYKFNERGIDILEFLMEMDYPTLRKLYQLVRILEDFDANKEVEFQAAFNFFANACADIPQPDTIQRELEFA